MFYLHEPVEFSHIGEGSRITFDMGTAKVRCTCPGCGAEVVADANDLYEKLVLTKDNESAYCADCSKKILAGRSVELEDDDYTTADMLIEELIDKTRDTDGAQNFVYLRDTGVIVDIEHCKVPELLDAVIAWADKEKEDLEDSLALCQKRIAELEKTKENKHA